MKNRVDFAREFKSWNKEIFWNIIYSDESLFRLANNGRIVSVEEQVKLINLYTKQVKITFNVQWFGGVVHLVE